MGGTYLLLDVTMGWLSTSFVENVTGDDRWISGIVVLNSAAMATSAAVLARPLWERKPAPKILGAAANDFNWPKAGAVAIIVAAGVLLPAIYFTLSPARRASVLVQAPGQAQGEGKNQVQGLRNPLDPRLERSSQTLSGSSVPIQSENDLLGNEKRQSEEPTIENASGVQVDARGERDEEKAASSPMPAPSAVNRVSLTKRSKASKEVSPGSSADGSLTSMPEPAQVDEPQSLEPDAGTGAPIAAITSASGTVVDQFNEISELLRAIERGAKETRKTLMASGRTEDPLSLDLERFAETTRDTRREFSKATGTGVRGVASTLVSKIRRDGGRREVHSRVVLAQVDVLVQSATEIDEEIEATPPDSTTIASWRDVRAKLDRLSLLMQENR